MMKWLVVFTIALSFNSCISYPIMHYSVALNVPLLTQKNEVKFSVATGTETFGIQSAYAFSKSFAVMGSYSDGVNDIFRDNPNRSINNGNRGSGELAIGYFNPLTEEIVLEIYGGTERYYRNYSVAQANTHLFSSIFSVNFTKPFVQLDLGFHNTRNHSLGLSLKFGYLMYDHYSVMVHQDPQNPDKWTSYPNYLMNAPIVEPCITYKIGGKRLSFQSQLGVSFTNSNLGFIISDASLLDPFFFNAGLSLRLFGEKKIK